MPEILIAFTIMLVLYLINKFLEMFNSDGWED